MNRTNVPLRQRGADLAAHLKTAVQSGPVRTLKEMTPEERAELERLYGKRPTE